MSTRETDWRSLVVQADPEHNRTSRYVREYEFTSAGRSGPDRTHEDGLRVFYGNYDVRGPYAPEVIATGGLTWHGIPLVWHDEPLTWTP